MIRLSQCAPFTTNALQILPPDVIFRLWDLISGENLCSWFYRSGVMLNNVAGLLEETRRHVVSAMFMSSTHRGKKHMESLSQSTPFSPNCPYSRFGIV